MPEIDVNIELYCTCGNGLCNNATAGKTARRNESAFTIAPCEKCLDRARDEGYENGYNKAQEEADNGTE